MEQMSHLHRKKRGHVGPYEIRKEAFDLGVKRKQLLDGGTIRYRADDRIARKDRVAINCFHGWRDWKNFTLTADFLGRDLGCGASKAPHEF
jgi:hypothetical protein